MFNHRRRRVLRKDAAALRCPTRCGTNDPAAPDRAQLAIVVDFAVENYCDAFVFIECRLIAGDEIDDREPSHAERNASGYQQALHRRGRDGPCARTSRAASAQRRRPAACVNQDWPNRLFRTSS